MQIQNKVAMSNNTELVEKFYRKKFAREARWEEWRERFIGIMERFHINYHSYADEYEEFVTQKMKQNTKNTKNTKNAKNTKNTKNTAAPSTPHHRDYYEVLGVDRSASEEEIKRSVRVLIMRFHPDYYQ